MGGRRLTWRWRVIGGVVAGLLRLLRWRVTVSDLGHVPRGGAVLAFNHHSYVDFVLVGLPVVRQLHRPLHFLGKREVFDSPAIGWAARWVEAIPVDRGSASSRGAALDTAVAALRAGGLVAVAPEQTISDSLELLPLRTGAVRMAQQAGVPVVPVIGWGTQRVRTRGTRLRLSPGLPITVAFGEPLQLAADADPIAATDELARRMAALLARVQTTYPDGLPAGARWVPARLGGGAPAHEQVVRDHQQRARDWEDPPPPS